MKTAVDRIGSGKVRQVNARFAAMASHYLFDPEFCNPASGWEKGQAEKNVQDARRRLWQPLLSFPDLTALNASPESQIEYRLGLEREASRLKEQLGVIDRMVDDLLLSLIWKHYALALLKCAETCSSIRSQSKTKCS